MSTFVKSDSAPEGELLFSFAVGEDFTIDDGEKYETEDFELERELLQHPHLTQAVSEKPAVPVVQKAPEVVGDNTPADEKTFGKAKS